MCLLPLASVLMQMLLDMIPLTLWENYRKLAMALYDKPDTNKTSQIQITPSAHLIYVFPWSLFFPYSLCYKSHIWDTDLLMWKTEPKEQQSIPSWQNTPAPLRWLGLAHELNCTYQQIRLKPSLEDCSKQGKLKVQLSQSLPNMALWGEGQCFICCWSPKVH